MGEDGDYADVVSVRIDHGKVRWVLIPSVGWVSYKGQDFSGQFKLGFSIEELNRLAQDEASQGMPLPDPPGDKV